MIDFAWPMAFYILPMPLLFWLFLPSARTTQDQALRVPFFEQWQRAQARETVTKSNKHPIRTLLAIIAWCFLVTAAARPEWTGEAVELPVSGRDLMIAVDLSGSMERPDFNLNGEQVDRLTVVKSVAGNFIERRVGDRIGLILFGKRAYVQTPLTFDLKTVRSMLEESVIGLAGKETAIGDAIGLAVKRLKERPKDSRVLILLTDGANTAGEVDPIQAASLAKESGLKIYTIGVGADRMEVDSFFGSRTVNPSSDLDEKTLSGIASMTGGKYFRAKDTRGLAQIYQTLDTIEPVKSDSEIFRPKRQLFYWALFSSLILFSLIAIHNLLGSLFSRNQWVKSDV